MSAMTASAATHRCTSTGSCLSGPRQELVDLTMAWYD